MRTTSLKRYLSLNFLLIAILPLILVSALSFGVMRQSLQTTISAKNLTIAKTLAREVDLFLEEPVRLLQQVRDIVAMHPDDGATIQKYLTTVTRNYTYLEQIQVISRNGTIKYAAPADPDILGADMSGQEYFTTEATDDFPSWSKTFISEQTGHPAVTVSLAGKSTIIVGYLNLDTLSSITTALSRDTPGHVYITDHKGVTISSAEQADVLQRINLRGLAEVQAGLSGREGTFLRPGEKNGEINELASVAQIGKAGWLVLYHEDVSLANAPLRFANRLLPPTLLFTAIMALFLAMTVLKRAMEPLSQLIFNTKKITQGDYSLQLQPTRFRELTELTSQFAAMAESVQQRERNLHYRLQLDTLVSNISKDFISMPPDTLSTRIQQALGEIGLFLHVDRAYIFLFDQHRKTMSCRFEWCAETITPVIHELQDIHLKRDVPWFTHTLFKEPMVYVPDVDELPAEAAAEQQEWQREGITSLLCLPMYTGKDISGFIGFDMVNRKKPWPEDLLVYLQILGELFASAINREQTDFILQRLQTAIDQASESVAILDTEGTIQYVNPNFTILTGFTRKQMLGKKLHTFIRPADQMDINFQEFSSALLRGEAWSGHFTGKRPDGSVTEQEITLSPIFYDKHSSGAVFVGRDITQQLQLEAQLQQSQRMESIGTLAGGIAHDFNNILSAIVGHAELALLIAETPEKVREHIKQVQNASKRATDLVRQILTFSRHQGQQQSIFQAQPIIKESIKLLRSSLPTTIEIQQEIAATDPIQADPTQIHQIVMNLCTNAFHAMQDKGGILTIQLSQQTITGEEPEPMPANLAPGEYVVLSVSDNGPGITEDVAERIFEPYFTTKEQGKGTGLGLAVVHGIVTQAGGAIRFSSIPDTETKFSLYFPAAEGREASVVDTVTQPLPTGSGHILVVDDEEILVQLEKQILTGLGYTVTTETKSTEALQRFQDAPDIFDLILTDMTMPFITGLELSKQIKKIRPDIPIIICSGYSESLDQDTLQEANINRLLNKPIERPVLAQTVAELIPHKAK